MNRKFEEPEVVVVSLQVEDVITASSNSQPGFEGWAPDSDDSEFGG